MACTPVITPYTWAPPCRTWRTYGANRVPMIPSPVLVISVKIDQGPYDGRVPGGAQAGPPLLDQRADAAADDLGRLLVREPRRRPAPTVRIRAISSAADQEGDGVRDRDRA